MILVNKWTNAQSSPRLSLMVGCVIGDLVIKESLVFFTKDAHLCRQHACTRKAPL